MLSLDPVQKQHRPTWQSELSLAYVHAVASATGVTCQRNDVDIFGVDVTLSTRVSGAEDRRTKLDVQIKSWTTPEEHNGYFYYPLDVDNYNELVARTPVRAILVLFVLPPSREDWFCTTDEEGSIRHCAYWMSFRGEQKSENATTKTVYVPKQKQFSVEALSKIMVRIANGGDP